MLSPVVLDLRDKTFTAGSGTVQVLARLLRLGGAQNGAGTHVRELAVRACFDCHSNQTRWPWYSHVAPMSWLVQDHVDEGRRELNFSDWNRGSSEADEAAETVRDREMPPQSYLLLHPEARLTDAEREQLARGLDASLFSARQSRAD